MREKDRAAILSGKSAFTGNFFAFSGILIALFVLTALSLGIAWPWLYCWMIRWTVQRIYIDGKQLRFSGYGGSIFGWYLLVFFSLIGISVAYVLISGAGTGNYTEVSSYPGIVIFYILMYAVMLFAGFLLIRWTVKNCHFAEVEDRTQYLGAADRAQVYAVSAGEPNTMENRQAAGYAQDDGISPAAFPAQPNYYEYLERDKKTAPPAERQKKR